MAEQAQIRRLRDMLYIAGTAVIAFGVWSLAKIGLFLSLADKNALQTLLGLEKESLTVTVYVVLLAIALIDFGLRAYMGMSARAEGNGKKRSSFYLVVAAIVALANVSSLFGMEMGTSFAMSPWELLISIVIEATSIAALLMVVYCSMRLRRMDMAKG